MLNALLFAVLILSANVACLPTFDIKRSENGILRRQTRAPFGPYEFKRLANFGVKRDLGPFGVDKKLGGFGVKRLGNFGVKRLAGFNVKRNSNLAKIMTMLKESSYIYSNRF
ncbi:DgyrCDS8134 [Dimorphilus gyrociliatus]|uniref:DgyrCDS8134 n=1 Tax=Dimorphilus gyrociliatus TaxID=2664684 RepID=A0A7I8VTG7_9ANNE|nr:DgyrCDS8134 [Dimorphilus gyrociliatus]